MKNIIFTVVFLSLLLTSCGTTQTATVQREVKNFDWTPPTSAPPKSSDLSIILLRPNYAEGFKDSNEPVFKKFAKNMGNDFEEMLVAKGYSLRGPYDSYDEIVFSDKSETDLMLAVTIDFNSELSNGALKKSISLGAAALGTTAYKYFLDGQIYLGGKINLTIYESMTKEKLWVKSIKLSDKTITVRTKKHDNATGIVNDPGYLNPISIALDEYYQQSLKTAWNQLEPQELIALKKQVKELRAKKGY